MGIPFTRKRMDKEDFRMKRITIFTLFLVLSVGLIAFAAPQQEEGAEAAKERTKIGIICCSRGGAYIFNDVQYQSFYLAEQKLWRELAEKNNLELVELEGGVLAAGGVSAVEGMINKQVDGIVFNFADPVGVVSGIIRAQELGIPVVATGTRPAGELDLPFVGFSSGIESKKLGKRTAELFQEQFPDKQARILISNNTALERNKDKAEGFVDGFTGVLPEAVIVERLSDNGTVRDVSRVVSIALNRNPDINVLFATSDLRAFGMLSAVERIVEDRKDEIVLASIGGSKRAFANMMDPNSPWRAEAAYLLKDFVDQTWNILNKMIQGEQPINSGAEYLIPSKIFVDPSLSEIEKYLRVHHKVNEFEY